MIRLLKNCKTSQSQNFIPKVLSVIASWLCMYKSMKSLIGMDTHLSESNSVLGPFPKMGLLWKEKHATKGNKFFFFSCRPLFRSGFIVHECKQEVIKVIFVGKNDKKRKMYQVYPVSLKDFRQKLLGYWFINVHGELFFRGLNLRKC